MNPLADIDTERAVLGAAVLSAGRLFDSVDLTGEDFHAPQHEELWNVMTAMAAVGKPIDSELVMAGLGDRRAVLAPALVECLSRACLPAAASWHAATLRALTMRRRIATAGAALTQLAGDGSPDITPEELAELARGRVDEHVQRNASGGSVTTFLDAALAGLDRWGTPEADVLATNWLELDEMLNGGLRPGHLVVVGARPGVGKSFLATELARNVAPRAGVLFSSLEMSDAEVTNRISAAMTGIPLATLTSGRASEADLNRLTSVPNRAADWSLVIDDRASVGVAAIRGRARDMTRRGHLGLVIVDYLQLVAPTDRKAPREQQVASVSRGLKLMAKDLRVPVVALAQVNRGPTQRMDDRPRLSDLRESGAIEADADEVLFLHRSDDEFYGQIEVNVSKNRHGSTGAVRLAWQPDVGRIGNAFRGAA